MSEHVVRRTIPWWQWDTFGRVIAEKRREPFAGNPDWASLAGPLNARGFVELPMRPYVDDMRHWFTHQTTHPGPHIYSPSPGFGGYRMDQVLRCPGMVDLFNDPMLLGLVETWLGCTPTLYSVNAWWSYPGTEPRLINSQYFHRDTDDWRFVTLFVYLTSVDDTSGPHQIVEGSHTEDWSEVSGKGPDFSGKIEATHADLIRTITGPAGTMFLCNTTALHRGLMPSSRSRLVAWARYGLGPNTNSADLEQGPLARCQIPSEMPDTPRNRYINRLLFDFDRGPI